MKTRFNTEFIFNALCLVALLAMQVGCIRESTGKCERESLLFIVVETEDPNTDKTLNGATVFLFNSNRTYLSSLDVSASDIENKTPIPVTYSRDDLPWAIVWGNLGDEEEVTQPASGNSMENMFVSMKRNADGYSAPSSRLFYGAKHLVGDPVEYITITPKTGQLAITVQGLPKNNTLDYYFTVDTPYARYDFAGMPLAGQTALKLPADFAGDDLITPEPYHMFHFPVSVPIGESLTVSLYETNADGTDDARLLASTEQDSNGQPIAIQRERTTNVLIIFTATGDIEVSLIITDWNEVIQWSDW